MLGGEAYLRKGLVTVSFLGRLSRHFSTSVLFFFFMSMPIFLRISQTVITPLSNLESVMRCHFFDHSALVTNRYLCCY